MVAGRHFHKGGTVLNPKLLGLFKEFPGLALHADEIGDPSSVKVERFDLTALYTLRVDGSHSRNADVYSFEYYSYARAYDANGAEVSFPRCGKRRFSLLQRLMTKLAIGLRDDRASLFSLLEKCAERDKVRTIAYVEYSGKESMLTVYKLHNGVTLSDMFSQLMVRS
jgi:hypothetical protein